MAHPDQRERPLSPHLSVYRPQITSVLSILHRMTGVALTGSAILVTAWFFAAAAGPEAFALVDGLLTSWVGQAILLASLWAVLYHLFNGIRHLAWDAGYGFDLGNVALTGWAVVLGSIGLTAVIAMMTMF